GGRGHAWAAGGVVLKPLDLSLEELRWQGRVLPDLHPQDVRLALPRRAATGDLVVEGWTAWERLEGRHQPGRWEDIIAAGERFHRALAGVPRPSFLDGRTSPWAIADRITWGEQSPGRFAEMAGLDRLLALRAPVVGVAQLVHGDLTGNVLFSPGLVPGVIDFSPYWRPPIFATAVVVGDALLFESAPPALAESRRTAPGFPQALVHALLFRLISDAIIHGYPAGHPVWLA
ncbi:MAG: aminoglycoside phosphotransferase, partial [Candidatus Dormibacteraeota bacterium]|nr:aminoglycoside phosphotransferase [Candidatus Dormibacteraeota bacterium]